MGASSIIRSTLQPARNLADVQSVVTSKTNLSLQNVDNTSDVNKPVSTAQQTALNLKANLSGGAVFSGGNVDITDAAGRVRMTPSGDITVYRSGGTTGYVFLNSAQTRYLGFDGTNYLLPTAPLAVGSAVLVNGSDYVMTRGATETVSGVKTFSANLAIQFSHPTSGIRQTVAGDFYLDISSGGGRGLFVLRNGNGYATDFSINTSGIGNFPNGLQVASKAVLSHAGAYTSGQVTYSTVAPSGGNDGDLWFQYS